MKMLTAFIGLLAATSFAHTAENKTSPSEVSFTLTQQNIASIDTQKDKNRKAFEADYGQFEVYIPKGMFPVSAPNCKKNIILRMPGISPDAPGAKKQLELKWQLFQSIHAVIEGRLTSVEVPIEVKHSPGIAPYMRLDKQGNPVLEWCNAYINANSMGVKSFTPAP